MREVSVDSLQQQVCTLWGESQEFRVFLRGGGSPTHASDIDWGTLWGLSVPGPLLFFLALLCRRRLSLSCQVALSLMDGLSEGEEGGVLSIDLSYPSPPSPHVHLISPSPYPSASPILVLLSFLGPLWNCQGLATMLAAPWR